MLKIDLSCIHPDAIPGSIIPNAMKPVLIA